MAWTFKDLLNDAGENVIRVWLNEQNLKARLKINELLRNLSVTPLLRPPLVKKIKGHEDVFELRVNQGGVQYRPLGGYGPEHRDFTLVLGAIEHNDNIRPPNAFATAERHIADVNSGASQVIDHDYEQPKDS